MASGKSYKQRLFLPSMCSAGWYEFATSSGWLLRTQKSTYRHKHRWLNKIVSQRIVQSFVEKKITPQLPALTDEK
jgi:hypothetical protein